MIRRFAAVALVASVTSFAGAAGAQSSPSPAPSAASPSPAPVAAGTPTAAASAPAATTNGPQVGAPAPDFSLRGIDGKTHTLASYRGSVLVLNIWATWCPPCREEMPDLIASAPRFARQHVALLGVDTTETPAVVRAYAAAKTVPYALAATTDSAFEKAYDVRYFPTTYVIDARGIVRARYIDVLDAKKLAAFVATAKRERDVAIVTPMQQKVDAMLASPSFAFTGDAPSIEANALRAEATVASVEDVLSDTGVPDMSRTRSEEDALLDRAIAALVDVGTSVKDKTLLTRLRAEVAANNEQWRDALQDDQAILAADPTNKIALAGAADAARELDERAIEVDALQKLATLDPTDVSAAISLGLAQNRNGSSDAAYATFASAIANGERDVAAKPGDAGALRLLASAQLYGGRTHAKNGDDAAARALFTSALATARRLPKSNPRHDMDIEEAQEGIVALDLGAAPRGARAVGVSLAPWTGPDLPGSTPDTIKYRLAVTGGVGKTVALEATGMPAHWVASFCSDTLCSPKRTQVVIPTSGVKLVEFQLVPPDRSAKPPRVRVTGKDGAQSATATT